MLNKLVNIHNDSLILKGIYFYYKNNISFKSILNLQLEQHHKIVQFLQV